MRPGRARLQRSFDEHLAAHDRIHRDIEQQSRQYRRDRRRAFGVRIGQPVVQRREPDFGPVPDQQKYERQTQHRGFELCLHDVEMRPQQSADALGAEDFFRGEVQQDRAEQRLRNAHAAENEVFPARLQTGGRAIQGHEQHGRQRRGFHCHPHQPEVVGRQRDQHGRHEELVHAVVQAQLRRADAAVLGLDTHVRTREKRRGQADERGERHEKHVERIDEELLAASPADCRE